MATTLPRVLRQRAYQRAAEEYLRSLPLEHFMEAVPQATQREITLASLALVKARRPEVQVFNELLVQYPLPRSGGIGQVVPDNMVILHEQPLDAKGSYDVEFQPARPFWMLEYVSQHNKRKDYEDNMQKYERELKVPYYLLFYPDGQELTLYQLKGRKYVSVKPNENDRVELPELNLEMGLTEGWVRYWYEGDLLPLPADLQRELDKTRRQLAEATRRADEEKHRADEEKHRADEEKHRADEEKHRADEEKRARLAVERELAELRAQRERGRPKRHRGPS
jgi:Uma2 family endonuclease